MYGERFEIVSDPFDEGDGITIRATSGVDPEIRTLPLPTALLISQADRFLKRWGWPIHQPHSSGHDLWVRKTAAKRWRPQYF
jgi:hypothetical protein